MNLAHRGLISQQRRAICTSASTITAVSQVLHSIAQGALKALFLTMVSKIWRVTNEPMGYCHLGPISSNSLLFGVSMRDEEVKPCRISSDMCCTSGSVYVQHVYKSYSIAAHMLRYKHYFD